MKKMILVAALSIIGSTAAYAVNWDWAIGMEDSAFSKKMKETGFKFIRDSEGPSSAELYSFWLRKSYCVQVRTADEIVADVLERPTSDCK